MKNAIVLNRFAALFFLIAATAPALRASDLILRLLVPLPSGHDVVIWVDRSQLSEEAWLPVLLGRFEEDLVKVDKVVTARRASGAGRAELTVFDLPFSTAVTETASMPLPALFEISGNSVFELSAGLPRKIRHQGRWEHARYQLGNEIPPDSACPFILR